MNESKRKAKNKYRAKIDELRVELYPTDEDIKARINERIAAREPKATYIKRLIREDIARQPIDARISYPNIAVHLDKNGRIDGCRRIENTENT